VRERLRLEHLTGPRIGQTDEIRHVPAAIGSEPDGAVVIPGIAPRHAVLDRRNSQIVLQDGGSAEGTFLAGHPIHEAVLRDGDVLELGHGGPRLRFHWRRISRRKAVRAVRWAMPEWLRRTAWTVSSRLRAAHRGTTRGFRVVIPILVAVLVFAVFWGHRESQRLQTELDRLSGKLRSVEEERHDFQARVEAERRRADKDKRQLEASIEEFRAREEELTRRLKDAASGEVSHVREELAMTRDRLATLESERAAGEHIIREFGPGVCLIQGSYAFYDDKNRPLRYDLDEKGKPKRDSEGSLELDVDKKGPVHTVEYFGTGFVVDRQGFILTNRHIAEPWWNDSTAKTLEAAGYHGRFVLFRAFFPRESEPYELEMYRRSDRLDLAILRMETKGRKLPPIVPLDRAGAGAVAGQPVVVVGYPTGLEAILAKAETGVVKKILDAHGTNSERVAEALSDQGLIRPSTTQGHIGDVTATDIVFDAPTTQGGSGGPVFNKSGQVIAVEYAVLPKFGGNSFGIPIHYAVELLRSRRAANGD
jgi:Trypsin-like peptidase domain/Inner membrane component of T3SS, cytoplasmic domain